MEWLNLHLSVLRTGEYLGATPTQRATWLNLIGYCCQQEDAGVIDDCRKWGDRQWQQVCAITLPEVDDGCELWKWNGENLEVNFYPNDSEKETKAKRKGGRIGNQKRWGKKKQSESLSDKHSDSLSVSTTKRNETELNQTEGAPPRIVSFEDAVKWMRDNGAGYTDDQVREQWLYYDAMRRPDDGSWQKPTRSGVMIPISDWRSELCSALARFASGSGTDGEKNAGESAAQKIFKLDQRIKELRGQVEAFENTQPELSEKLATELAELETERAKLA